VVLAAVAAVVVVEVAAQAQHIALQSRLLLALAMC
jgi:hypothetical protein